MRSVAQQQWPASHAVTQPYWWPLPPLAGSPAPLEALVQGQTVETAHGSFFRRRLVFSLEERYGSCRLGDFLRLNPRAAAALARSPDLGDVALERMLFLDTETTGLAGGTGTYAFLVGLGSFVRAGGEPQFVLDQCFMRSYGEERAMLSWVVERLDSFEALATFNGRAFDVPLLQTRLLMSRLRVDLEEWLHLDLLPPARRIWRPSLQSCALQSLERHVLGVGRQDDVESFLIPAIYHQYLRDGDGRYLQKVFNHNQADVLAMVAIAIRACTAFDVGWDEAGGTGGAGGRDRGETAPAALSPGEYVGLGRVYEQMDNLAAAERAYRLALDGPLPRDLRGRTLLALAALLKRAGRYEAAAELWEMLAAEAPAQSVVALVELAKYWEHRRRDPHRAHELALQARERWLSGLPAAERPLPGLSRWPAAATPAPPDDFSRRLARLDQKRRRAGGLSSAGEAQSKDERMAGAASAVRPSPGLVASVASRDTMRMVAGE